MQNFSTRENSDTPAGNGSAKPLSGTGNIQASTGMGSPQASAGNGSGPVDIKVSGIFTRDDRKIAYVSFTDGGRSAEGIIPDCVITRNKGFSEDERSQLEAYMKRELDSLKKTASGINVVKALMEPGLT